MHYHNKLKRFLSLILICVLAFACSHVTSIGSAAAGKTNINELQNELTDLQKQQAEIKKQISKLQSDISNKEALKSKYEEQIKLSQSEIENYNTQLTLINEEMAIIEADLDKRQKELTDKKEKFKQRLRAMAMTGDTSMLGILVSANDFSDFLYKSEFLKSVGKQDQALLDELTDEINSINNQKKTLERKRNNINSLTIKLSKKQIELNNQITELNNLISSLNEQKIELQTQYNENTDDLKKLEQEIAEASKNTGNLVYSGSEFMWPVPGYYTVSSQWRTAKRPNHTGIDIASRGISGKNIIASADGIVTLSQYYYGYGNCVMINHGKSSKNGKVYVTLYGHASELLVKKGQYVTAGTVIARVGNTGNSTGPHLHFEVRVDSKDTNPMNYFSSKK